MTFERPQHTMYRCLPILMMLAFALWLNWYFLKAAITHGTVLLETGIFYYDRLINMGFAKAAQEWGINFYEPFNRIEPIFYQFLGWWVVGFAARLSGLQPFAIANVVHIIYVPVFFAVAWRLFSVVARSREAVTIGVGILFLFGNLEWFLNGEYSKAYGDHARLLTFLQQSFGFYMDSYSVLFGYIALIAWLKYLQTDTSGWKQILAFWLPATLAYTLHYLPAIFFIMLFNVLLFGATFGDLDTSRRRRVLLIIAGLVPLYGIMLWYWSFRPPLTFLCGSGLVLWLVFLIHDRNKIRYLLVLVPLLPLALLTGANLLAFQSYYGALANDYNATVRQGMLSIPAYVLLVCYFPVVVLTTVSVFRETDPRWRMVKCVMVMVVIAVIFNDKLGYNNHPYRFVPYTFPLWAMLAGDGLLRLWRDRRHALSKIILGLTIVPLAAGVWTNVNHHGSYASAANCRPVAPLVLALVASIEKVRSTFPQAVFYVEPALVTADRLAPFTGAKFNFLSNINYRSSYGFYRSYEEMLVAARMAGLRIDYVIIPRQVEGIVPVQVIESGQHKFLVYHVVDYALQSS